MWKFVRASTRDLSHKLILALGGFFLFRFAAAGIDGRLTFGIAFDDHFADVDADSIQQGRSAVGPFSPLPHVQLQGKSSRVGRFDEDEKKRIARRADFLLCRINTFLIPTTGGHKGPLPTSAPLPPLRESFRLSRALTKNLRLKVNSLRKAYWLCPHRWDWELLRMLS